MPYTYAWSRLTGWCNEQGRSALPATAETLAEYTATLISRDAAPASIDQALAVVQRRHRDQGQASPDTATARLLLWAYRRDRAEQGKTVRRSAPVTVEPLRVMVDAAGPVDTPAGLRDRLLLVLGFSLMARRSELVGLDLADVAAVPEGLEVTVRTSKTDRDSAGTVVPVPYGSDPSLCPVRLYRVWAAMLAEHGGDWRAAAVPGGPARQHRRPAHRRRGPAHPPDARRPGGSAGRADPDPARAARRWGDRSGPRGAPVSAITRQGRWAEGSPVVHAYIRTVDQWREHPLRGVL
ncbi:Integrase family protein [Parafrankia sp. Ea1.12]|uniref:integrase n=1 Tax=Parafrankia sp. Ea1.12 TaxID=573499 RepID=UPI000DA5AFA5|nr:integrase [Parafrankia sp. Ea1.12]SQD99526.1 Integrase family protein [Parafrankia sp. Ea1.12]